MVPEVSCDSALKKKAFMALPALAALVRVLWRTLRMTRWARRPVLPRWLWAARLPSGVRPLRNLRRSPGQPGGGALFPSAGGGAWRRLGSCECFSVGSAGPGRAASGFVPSQRARGSPLAAGVLHRGGLTPGAALPRGLAWPCSVGRAGGAPCGPCAVAVVVGRPLSSLSGELPCSGGARWVSRIKEMALCSLLFDVYKGFNEGS